MDQPLVSVIVPVYGVEDYLEKCIESMRSQTYRNLQIILIDDGSPDNCGAICDEYAKTDSRISVIHKPNGGVASARNAGLRAAMGEYIGWVDPDDWIQPDMFEYLLSNAVRYGADITVCGRIEQYVSRQVYKGWAETELINCEEALKRLLENREMGNYLWDKLFKRGLFEGVAFPEGRTFEDVAVMHRLFVKAERVLCLPEYKYNYTQRENSIVGKQSLIGRINQFNANRERYDELSAVWPQFEPYLAAECIENGINVWRTCGGCRAAERAPFQKDISEAAKFAQGSRRTALPENSLGIVGRLSRYLLQFDRLWSYRLVHLLYELREKIYR